SLWHLFERDRLPERIAIIGAARHELSDIDFRRLIEDAVRTHDNTVDEDTLQLFLSLFSYAAGSFDDEATFRALAKAVEDHESRFAMCADKLVYLAVPPTEYETIFTNLAGVQLNVPCGGEKGWTRILIEKPFGKNATEAKALDMLLGRFFKEEQIYRIDHYFFKEIVQGIENFRFSNNLFEHGWGNELIDSITIRLNESIDVSKRGAFYDTVGALRDVGQNHLLSMLALLTMEYAPHGNTERIRARRAEILSTLAPWSERTLSEETVRAQYDGYTATEQVAPDSQTETYFALKSELMHPRWRGMPIYLEAGKALAEARKEIVLTLKHASPCSLCEVGPHEPNKIVFRLEPRDEIVIHFWTKKPGFEHTLEERTLSFFLYEKENKSQYVEEYASLLYHAMLGDQSLFVSKEEVAAEWVFVDPVITAWQKHKVPLLRYAPGTTPSPIFLKQLQHEMPVSRGMVGIVGLGKMGGNIARQLATKGWHLVGYNKLPETSKQLADEGVITYATSLKDLAAKLSTPRTIWLMVPHQAVDAVLAELVPHLSPGDTIIDGGNSFFEDSKRRAEALVKKSIQFLDVGVSGGPEGALSGACIMIGGEREVFEQHEQLFRDIAAPQAYQFFPGFGRGHFIKMVHNGIEYGMMQSLAEGFMLLKEQYPDLSLERVANVYNHRSVIESRLVGWLENALQEHGNELEHVSGSVDHTGEAEWTVKSAEHLNVSLPVIEKSLAFRVASKKHPSYVGKILSALRNQFGGHSVDSPDSNNKII
ncbi:MAG: decarboxylating 6-phosphogluconate dehydrogenase, partial [Candidatus Spechtbacterales bacterium]